MDLFRSLYHSLISGCLEAPHPWEYLLHHPSDSPNSLKDRKRFHFIRKDTF